MATVVGLSDHPMEPSDPPAVGREGRRQITFLVEFTPDAAWLKLTAWPIQRGVHIQPTEGTLMSKMKSKTKSKRTKTQRKPRTMALAIAEPRLRAPRSPRIKAVEHGSPSASAQLPQRAHIYEMMLSWSPWSTVLRQQAFMAQAFSSMVKAQQQFAQIWRLPARQAPRPARR